jgi:TonB family protein
MPAGDSAREYLDRANALAPDDPRVVGVRAALAAAVVGEAHTALDAADVNSAEGLMLEARRLDAAGEALAQLERDVASARNIEADRRRTEWLDAAQRRIASGALTAPRGASAVHYLTTLQAEAPEFFGLQSTWDRLVRELLDEATVAIERQDWPRAEAAVEGLRSAPNAAAVASDVAGRLENARLEREYLVTPVAASELELLSHVAPDYPKDALERGIEGWVELEYVVDRAGVPNDVTTIAAEPPGRFEAAALEAVREYRYEPFERGGRRYARRVRLRVRFSLE